MNDQDAAKHPGRILAERYMIPLGLSSNRLGAAIGVPANRISEIVKGRRSLSADTALRLAELFHTDAEYWMTLQSDHDLARVRETNGAEIRRVVAALRVVDPLPPLPIAETDSHGEGEAADSSQIGLF